MALSTGTHWEGSLLGSDKAQGGLCDDVPIQVQNLRHRCSWLVDFLDNQDDDSLIVTTITSGSGAMLSGVSGGALRLTATVDAQGVGNAQYNHSFLVPTVGAGADGFPRHFAMGMRFRHSDWSIANWAFGLGLLGTTFVGVTGTLVTPVADNFVGFHHVVDAVAQGGLTGPDGNDLRLVSAGGGVANYQATLLSQAQVPLPVPADAAVDNTFIELGFRVIGNQSIEFYRNGALRHRRLANNAIVAASGLFPSVGLIANGSIDNFDIDYMWLAVSRSPT